MLLWVVVFSLSLVCFLYWSGMVPIFRKLKVRFETDLEDAVNKSISSVTPLLLCTCNSDFYKTDPVISLLSNVNFCKVFNHFILFVQDFSNATEINYKATALQNYDFTHFQKLEASRESGLILYEIHRNKIKFLHVYKEFKDVAEIIWQLSKQQRKQSEGKIINIEKEILEDPLIPFCPKEFQTINGTVSKAVQDTLCVEPAHYKKMLALWFYTGPFRGASCCNKLVRLTQQNQEVYRQIIYFLPIDVSNAHRNDKIKMVLKLYFTWNIDSLLSKPMNVILFFNNLDSEPLVIESNLLKTEEKVFNVMVESFLRDHKITILHEIRAQEQFLYIFPEWNRYIETHHCKTLENIIEKICFSKVVKERKVLLLTFSHSETFSDLIQEKSISWYLKDFVCVPWALPDNTVLTALQWSVRRHFNIPIMEEMLTKKKSIIFLFTPIANTLVLHSFIESTDTLRSMKSKLIACQEFFVERRTIEEMLSLKDENGSVAAIQQYMCDQFGDSDFDCFQLDKGQGDKLKEKINYGLFGPPEENVSEEVKKDRSLKTDEMYKIIVDVAEVHSEYYKEVTLTCIFNCLIPLPEVSKEICFAPSPIFVIRKCINSENPCRIFIDSDLRVYESWDDYLKTNQLFKGMMVFPKDGRYKANEDGIVYLESRFSPSCGFDVKLLEMADMGSSVIGLAAGFLGFATLIPGIVIAPAVGIGAAGAALAVGGYSLIRGASVIYDRHTHGQSMSIYNSESRGVYLNVAAGIMSFAGAGSAFALTQLAQAGTTIEPLTQLTVNGIQITNLTVSGTALANSGYEVWSNREKRPPSAFTILQLSSSVLFFSHAVFNVKLSSTIIDEAQIAKLSDMKDNLRNNNHRKILDKTVKETIRVTGDVQEAHGQVIRYLENLDNRDETLAILARNNKKLNANKIRFAVENDGLSFNGMKIDISEFSKLSRNKQGSFLAKLPPMKKGFPPQVKQTDAILTKSINIIRSVAAIGSGIIKLTDSNSTQKEKCFILLEMFSECVQTLVTDILNTVIRKIMPIIGTNSLIGHLTLSDYELCSFVLQHLIDFFKSQIQNDNVNTVIELIERGIIMATVNIDEAVNNLVTYVLYKLKEFVASQIPDEPDDRRKKCIKRKTKCITCSGEYFVA